MSSRSICQASRAACIVMLMSLVPALGRDIRTADAHAPDAPKTGVRKPVAVKPGIFCAGHPRNRWISAAEVGAHLQRHGFELVRVRLSNDRCYVVEARDAHGNLRSMLMHPVTSEILR